MNLRIFSRSVACCLASLAFFASCNSDSSYELGELSSDGQISNFTISSLPRTAIDTITYPAMTTTKFTIINQGEYLIFNRDSLPQYTDIRTLSVTLSYSSTPSKIELVYKDKNGADSIPEESWNTSDSIKFFKNGNDGRYLPEFRVIAPDGTPRRYTVRFNIHRTDPDSLRWDRVEDATGAYADLLKDGVNKTIINTDSTKFYSLSNDGAGVYFYSGNIATTLTWQNLTKTNLPVNANVKSFQLIDGTLVVLADDGKVYTAKESNVSQWTAYTSNNITAILGAIVGDADEAKSNLLFVVKKADGTSVFAKAGAEDINSLTELTNSKGESVPSNFPIKNFGSLAGFKLGLSGNYLVLTGGNDVGGNIVNRSWMIHEEEGNKLSIIEGYKYDDENKFRSGVSTYAYNKTMYMIGNDSIYTSVGYGDLWAKADKKQALKEEMMEYGMGMPSIVVDKNNFVWIFGGKFKSGSTYSRKVWNGRLNKLTYKKD